MTKHFSPFSTREAATRYAPSVVQSTLDSLQQTPQPDTFAGRERRFHSTMVAETVGSFITLRDSTNRVTLVHVVTGKVKDRKKVRILSGPSLAEHHVDSPLELEFSSETVSLYADGLCLQKELIGEKLSVEAMVSILVRSAEISEFLRLNVLLAFGGFARSCIQLNGSGLLTIGEYGRFRHVVDAYLQKSLTIVPSHYEAFSLCLFRDVSLFLQGGGSIVGDWGRMISSGRSLSMMLSGSPSVKKRVPPRAIELE